MADADGNHGSFLGRWSQRKARALHGPLPAAEPGKAGELSEPNAMAGSAANVAQSPVGLPIATLEATPQFAAPIKPQSPTLEDVAKLTTDSDYSAFAARHVDNKVRNAAMRKLFAGDPHFNVMDGLDVYIDDYSVGEPIAKSMLRQMVQARSLGLLDDELVDQDKPPSTELPPDLSANDNGATHENTDLQLQPDDAPGHSGVANRAEPAEEPHAASNFGLDADALNLRPS